MRHNNVFPVFIQKKKISYNWINFKINVTAFIEVAAYRYPENCGQFPVKHVMVLFFYHKALPPMFSYLSDKFSNFFRAILSENTWEQWLLLITYQTYFANHRLCGITCSLNDQMKLLIKYYKSLKCSGWRGSDKDVSQHPLNYLPFWNYWNMF